MVVSITWTIIQHFAGYNTTKHEIGQYTRMLGSIVFYVLIVVAILELRKQQNGSLSFGEGFKTGSILSLIYSLGVSIWYALYGEVMNIQYKPSLVAFERSKLEAAHASPEMIAAKMKEADMSSGGSFLSYVLLFVFMSLSGIIIAAIASLILKRKRTA